MDQTVLTVEYMNERNRALTKAGEGIVAARKSLDQLEVPSPERNRLG